MSKLQKPDYIVFIGATLYKDLVKRAELERAYPYIKDATHVDKFSTYTEDIIDDVLKLIKYKKIPASIFVIDKYFDKVNNQLLELGLEPIQKSDNNIFTLNGTILILKRIKLFDDSTSVSKISNKHIANFKAFGREECLQNLEDALQEHASIIKVLPTWYNIEIKDNIGENTLIDLVKDLNVKILPIRSLRASVIEYLTYKKKTLTCAESCTGGLLAAKLTSVPGASAVIKGTMVTYSNTIKHKWLNVKEETLEKYGAVSSECVSQMLDGIEKASESDISIAISGIAGPTGGTPDKPVGTVFIGIKNGNMKKVEEFHFKGDRAFVQEQSARKALEMLIQSEPDFFEFFKI